MNGISQIQYCVAQDHSQFLIFTTEHTGQRAVLGLDDDAISNPLPKLFLSRPKLHPILANDTGRAFPSFLLFLVTHSYVCVAFLSNTSALA